jgi:hypothetical protein
MVEKQYAASMTKGLWKTAYASTNANKFFVELDDVVLRLSGRLRAD